MWFKLAVLVGLAGWGIAHWDPTMLSRGVPDAGIGDALYGAASVFMAYEGFQLLTYDYEDIETPNRTLPRAVISAIVVVIGVYVMVALGTVMLVGADVVVRRKEVALAVAGQQAFGVMGSRSRSELGSRPAPRSTRHSLPPRVLRASWPRTASCQRPSTI